MSEVPGFHVNWQNGALERCYAADCRWCADRPAPGRPGPARKAAAALPSGGRFGYVLTAVPRAEQHSADLVAQVVAKDLGLPVTPTIAFFRACHGHERPDFWQPEPVRGCAPEHGAGDCIFVLAGQPLTAGADTVAHELKHLRDDLHHVRQTKAAGEAAADAYSWGFARRAARGDFVPRRGVA